MRPRPTSNDKRSRPLSTARTTRKSHRPTGRATVGTCLEDGGDVPSRNVRQQRLPGRDHVAVVGPFLIVRVGTRLLRLPQPERARKALGEAMQGGAIGKFERSNHPNFAVGDYVSSGLGWRDYFNSSGEALAKVDPAIAPLTQYLGARGGTGFTAYVGLLDFMDPQEGETVFVSGAAGAVGLITGQLAKIRGCRVVGSAGSDEKVDRLQREFGYDAAFDYKTDNLEDALSKLCPDDIEIYFDNVGGDHLQAGLDHMKDFGRISACGAISLYNLEDPEPGPTNLSQIVRKSLTIKASSSPTTPIDAPTSSAICCSGSAKAK